MPGPPFKDLREECCCANRALAASGLIDLTFGNASVLDILAGAFAIKPSGVPYEELTPDHMVVLDLEGKVVWGGLNPSSDTPTHRRLFKSFGSQGVRGVVHTHSRAAVGFAQAGREIPLLGTTHADYFRGPVPVTRVLTEAEVGGSYEWETGKVILECFQERNPLEIPAVLVRHHGPFAWGESGAKAVENALALELIAEMASRTLAMGDPDPAPHHLSEKHFLRKHGAGATYGQRTTDPKY